ncbi:zinc finger protein on ecdysone puffs isoform X1 [Bombyx mandarina]|uniref:Zinc finger protein on ecdysone puffs isoform X1 n=1 Tax=Bombyx mandarina TaxID=7092 RepID=A0A6J2JFN0_BOMMA|nr:zinc finger protein on ecdysone puffs isoform X1 [Bombyx mandarina]
MANRRPQPGRRTDFGRNDRGKNFPRNNVSPWQSGGPGERLPNLFPLAGGSAEATLALASNLLNLFQPKQNPVPSLLDMPIRRDFGPNMGRFDRGYEPNRMGNHGNFRRTGNYNRAGERINMNRKPFRPNEGQRQHNKNSPKKETDSKAKPVKESEQEEKTTETDKPENERKEPEENEKQDVPKTRYDDINSKLLKCHICHKSMWDGRSFENHLSGRAHAIMMQKTVESYALTADTMRQEYKIREMKRTRKSGQQPARDFYCAMCDMYAANGAAHRTTVGHRKLKKYLHPFCNTCHKELPTRIELDEHRLTAEHLRAIQDKQDVLSKPKPEMLMISTLGMEQSYLCERRQRRPRRDDVQEEKHDDNDKTDEQQTDTENKEKIENEDQEMKDVSEKADSKPVDDEKVILDFKEDDDLSYVTQDMFPSYSTERGVGQSFLTEFRCIQCKLCKKLLDSQETADVHLRTWRHHVFFLKMLSEKTGHKPAGPQSTENSNGKRPSERNDQSGNWKRRKTSSDHEGQDYENDNDNDNDNDNEHANEYTDTNRDEQFDDGIPNNDDLEDWEQSVDEILEDEKKAQEELGEPDIKPKIEPEVTAEIEDPVEEKPEVAEVIEQPPEKEKSPQLALPVPDVKPKPSPRARARGRGRGRGRY